MLVLPEGARAKNKKGHSPILEDDLFDFLKSRAGKLEAVVITGGEPTLHKDLPEFIRKIKKLGFKIKLDTNGTNPEMLSSILKAEWGILKVGKEINVQIPPAPFIKEGVLVDYIAMDIKAPLNKYEKIIGAKVNLRNIKKSIKIIMNSGLPYEFRTTVVPGLIKKSDIKKMGALIKGADKWYLQQFKSDTDLVDKKFKKVGSYSEKELEEMRRIGEGYVRECGVR